MSDCDSNNCQCQGKEPDKNNATTGDGFTRRDVLRMGLATAAAGGVVAAASIHAGETVWQIDPEKCIMCGKCETECVLAPTAVRCLHAYERCGYCELCFGFFEPKAIQLDEGAENQLCPTGALVREFVEEPYFEYHVDRDRCVGCALCVAGCTSFGNGSLFLQIDQDICVHCNECAIARECPSDAITRADNEKPYHRAEGLA